VDITGALLESKIITAAALLNLVLDPIFIFGLFGFPRLEIQGAALATLVSTGIMLVFTMLYVHGSLRIFASPFAPIRVIFDSWRHMLTIGIPAAVYGVDAVAGFGIAMRIEPIFLIPFYALSAVSSPFFGQNIGFNRFDRLLEARRVATRFCVGFGLVLAVVLIVIARSLIGLFTESEVIEQIALQYLWIVSLSWGAYGMVMMVNASFNGMGKPFPGVVISVCRVIVVFLPLAFLGRWMFGLPGLFGASLVSNLVMGLASFIWIGHQIRASR